MKSIKRLIVLVLIMAVVFAVVGCKQKDNGCCPSSQVTFEYWNECAALTGLKDYVTKVTDQNSDDFIPVEDRIAVFDMDGTLCGELFPEYLEYLLLEYRCLDDPDYKDIVAEDVKAVALQIRESGQSYKTPAVADFDVIHGTAQAKAFSGMTPAAFIAYVKQFLQRDAKGFEGLKYADSVYKPMIEVVRYLQQNDFTVYVVSGSDRMICRAVICDVLDIPPEHVIGMDVTLVATHEPDSEDNEEYHYNNLHYQFNDGGEDTLVRGDQLWLKNLKMNKVFQIAQEIGKQPVLSFGNSSGDVSMHEYTVSGNKYKAMAFMLVADDTARDHADLTETNKRIAKWNEYGYTIISMKDDFKTIYGYDVRKVD